MSIHTSDIAVYNIYIYDHPSGGDSSENTYYEMDTHIVSQSANKCAYPNLLTRKHLNTMLFLLLPRCGKIESIQYIFQK